MTPPALTFECRPCGRVFEAAGTAEEWTSAIYGPCREYSAACPECSAPVKEYRPKAASSGAGNSFEGCGGGPCGEGPCSDGPCGGACPRIG